MKGEKTVTGTIHEIRNDSGAVTSEYNGGLFELLRETRRKLAAKENVPPYIIFSDKTLREISTVCPGNRLSLSEIHGIGSHKLEKYGDILLAEINKYCSENDVRRNSEIPKLKASLKPVRYIQVAEMFNSGKSISDIEEKENIQQRTIVSYLYKYIQEGGSIRKDLFISDIPSERENLSQIMNAFHHAGTERLKPVFEELDGSVDYDTLGICRLYYLGID